ncbi:hypothetical protein GCM10027570_48950 [Streptomonospora sediminis]
MSAEEPPCLPGPGGAQAALPGLRPTGFDRLRGRVAVERKDRAGLPIGPQRGINLLGSEQYGDVLVARERAGLPIRMADAQIAAICRVHGAMCATRNAKDFVATGVELVDPWAS